MVLPSIIGTWWKPVVTPSEARTQGCGTDSTIRPELPDNEIWAFDNFMVVQRWDIVEKRRAILKPAMKRHDHRQEARVKTAFEFSFAENEEKMVFDGPSLIVAGLQDS